MHYTRCVGEFTAKVHVNLKPEVPDHSGNALVTQLHQLGFDNVLNAKSGKLIVVTLAASSEQEASQRIDEMSSTFFANPVIEQATTASIEQNIDAQTTSPVQKPARKRRSKKFE